MVRLFVNKHGALKMATLTAEIPALTVQYLCSFLVTSVYMATGRHCGIRTRRHPDKAPTVFFGQGGNGTFGLGATGYFKMVFICLFYEVNKM